MSDHKALPTTHAFYRQVRQWDWHISTHADPTSTPHARF